jgi:hypothetical protein
VDQQNHRVHLQAYPQQRGHALDVVACDVAGDVEQLHCRKECRALLESGHYWQRVYPEAATYTQSQ